MGKWGWIPPGEAEIHLLFIEIGNLARYRARVPILRVSAPSEAGGRIPLLLKTERKRSAKKRSVSGVLKKRSVSGVLLFYKRSVAECYKRSVSGVLFPFLNKCTNNPCISFVPSLFKGRGTKKSKGIWYIYLGIVLIMEKKGDGSRPERRRSISSFFLRGWGKKGACDFLFYRSLRLRYGLEIWHSLITNPYTFLPLYEGWIDPLFIRVDVGCLAVFFFFVFLN